MKVEFEEDDYFCPGFKAAGISSGIKKAGKKDLALIVSEVSAVSAGVFTTNKVKAAPVIAAKKRLQRLLHRAILINSGNANACTGDKGMDNAMKAVDAVEVESGLKRGELLPCATGVIGVPLPADRIVSAAPLLVSSLGKRGWLDAAQAIMTTDAFPKICKKKARIKGKDITVLGIAKGAGMICPDMATMLAFFATDACVERTALKGALKEAVDMSFNRISVDGDTSTNDTVIVLANGVSGIKELRQGTAGFKRFSSLLTDAAKELSYMIVRDGEGATRFIEIRVSGAKTKKDADMAARTVANSLLVKTAFFGGDPNWGRIMAALGRSRIMLEESRVGITFNNVKVVSKGMDTGKEKSAAEAIKTREVIVRIDLGLGDYSTSFWTSDIGHEYVRINSAYRT
ncbi:MAG: bifunctional glutamate N-acetyltransferase/amino-acid acetyltransferase ArgJ [Deltaproteobacteria bacterium]|nr:bifunctional glutamate N-acetyltransferase/amino-acid acetyltransferase ArgJ [Deltaproteobacteria bacterium]